MPFAHGSVSFRRFAVTGDAPTTCDQALLDKLAEFALQPSELGVPADEEYGWSGGRHVLDQQFTFDHNVYAEALHFALRIDTNKAPGELKEAYRIMEEEAVAKENPSGFISKIQKREVKETVRRKLEDELRSGRFRRSKLLPILWDLPNATLYCTAGGTAQEKLLELFERTFELKLAPVSSGSLALRVLEPHGRRRDYEDLRPTRFVLGPIGEDQYPEYPWVAKGSEPKDFLGNEFLLWLWHEADQKTSIVGTEAGDVTILFDRALDLDCAYGQSGRDGLRGDGVSQMPEALDGLRSGKVPRKAGLILDANNIQYSLNLSAEALAFGSLHLPKVEDAETMRVLFEERIALLRDFCKVIDSLYAAFLKKRAGSGWEGQVNGIRKWIMQASRPATAMAKALIDGLMDEPLRRKAVEDLEVAR